MMRTSPLYAVSPSPQKASNFWRFQSVFWLLGGGLLFLSGISQGPVSVSVVRNVYYAGIGVVLSNVLAYGFETRWAEASPARRLLLGLTASLGLGTLATLPINPVTFGQLGLAWQDLTLGHWFAGSMNYSLVLMVWTLLYLFLTHRQDERQTQPLYRPPAMISAAQGRQAVAFPADQMLFVKAAGDYVELHTSERCLLKRATMRAMEARLQPYRFIRIHRSILLNADKVLAVEALSRGTYRFRLEGDRFVQSSRSFAGAVRLAFLEQA